MPRLTLRTLLAYIDDTLEPAQARALGRKVAESDEAKLLIERIKKVTRRRGLKTPVPDGSDDDVSDPNVVAEYLSDNLDSDQLKQMESTCLDSDVHLAEVAACHQILTLLLTEPVRVPPTANQRMYGLVPPPASDPNRKPGKTIPVGGVAPPLPELADDDPDAALLLGMKRYAAAGSRGSRLAILAAVAAIGLFLVVAVVMALPSTGGEPPLSTRGPAFASAAATGTGISTPTPPSTIVAPLPGTPEPKDTSGKVTPEPKPAPEPKGKLEPKTIPEAKVEPKPTSGGKSDASSDKKVPLPNAGRGIVGAMDTPNVIVLTKSPDPGTPWLRMDKDIAKVNASSTVMALPGYKAEVKLDTNVDVLLWGNLLDQIPESYLMKLKVFQSRVRFHQPPADRDADITLEEGRIYLHTSKAGGAKIRIRTSAAKWSMSTAAWDIDLPNDKAQVMVEAHTAFVPGTPYPKDGVGGTPPQTDLVLVVVRGTADVEDLDRVGKKYSAIPTWNQLAWNSKTDQPAVQSEVNKKEVVPEPDPLILSDKGEQIQKSLSEAASNLKDRDGIRTLLESRMNFEKRADNDTARIIAVYSYAAILDGVEPAEAKVMLSNLYDVLADSERAVVRQAAIAAAGDWMARAPGNTTLFVNMLVNDKMIPVEDANLMARLLRGYSAATYGPAAGNSAKIDELVAYLDSDYIPIREAALGCLVFNYDVPAALAGALKTRPPLLDVGSKIPGYDQFVKDWRARGQELKAWMETTRKK